MSPKVRSLLETLLEFDYALFQLINQDWHTPFLDTILPYWREKTTWIPIYLFIITYALWKYRWQGLLMMVMLVATLGLADTMSSKVIKKNVERLRPCKNEELKSDVKLLVDCGSGYSFTSSHATNHFSIAIFLILLWGYKHKWLPYALVFWATSIAFAQVYVGVHFPLDIVAGSLLGILIGYLGYQVYKFIQVRWHPNFVL